MLTFSRLALFGAMVLAIVLTTALSAGAQQKPQRCICPLGFSVNLSDEWTCECPKPIDLPVRCALVCPLDQVLDAESCKCGSEDSIQLNLIREDRPDIADRKDAAEYARAARNRDRSFAYENKFDRDIVIIVRTPSDRDRAHGNMSPGDVREFKARAGDTVIVKEYNTSGRDVDRFLIRDDR